MEELPIFNQNHGLTPLEKSQFFDCFKLLLLISLKEVFLCKISWNIFLANFTKNKKNETVAIFLTKTIDYPSSKNANFFTSFDLLFL